MQPHQQPQFDNRNPPQTSSTPSKVEPKREKAATGAIRETLHHKGDKGFPLRYDLIFTNEVAVRRLAETYGEGSLKYGADNWKQGFDESVLLNHAFDHLRKWLMKDRSEDHIAHAVWNLFTLMWVEEQMPELLDVTGIKELK